MLGQAESDWCIIQGRAWFQLIQEPQPLLGKRERKWFCTRYRHNRWRLPAHSFASGTFDQPGQFAHCWSLKQTTQWQVYLKCLTRFRDELSSKQGMSSQGKKVIMNTHLLAAQ